MVLFTDAATKSGSAFRKSMFAKTIAAYGQRFNIFISLLISHFKKIRTINKIMVIRAQRTFYFLIFFAIILNMKNFSLWLSYNIFTF